MTSLPVLFALLVALGVFLTFVAIWRLTTTRDPVEERLAEYGGLSALTNELDADQSRPKLQGANRLLLGLGIGSRLAKLLVRADVPLTVAEFAMILLAAGVVGFLLGLLRSGLALAVLLGAISAYLPILYLRRKESQRQRAFVGQIPDILTILVGALRAGYGLTQAIDVVAAQLPPPASKEFGRVMRAISLGIPVQRALSDAAERVGSPDLDMVVTAINVQYETGGNLAQTLETIGETVRDRIRMQREIRVLTSQQRLTGYVLALIPVGVGTLLFLLNPGYMQSLLNPQWIWLPILALCLQVLGFLVIRRIADIEV